MKAIKIFLSVVLVAFLAVAVVGVIMNGGVKPFIDNLAEVAKALWQGFKVGLYKITQVFDQCVAEGEAVYTAV